MPKRPDITQKVLNDLYFVQRKSKKDICKELNITIGSLNYLLLKYGLTKTNGMAYKTGITKEMLYNAVYVEKLTNKQIMEKFNIGEQTIRNLIRDFGIPMRWDNSRYVDDVVFLYTKEKLSLTQISKKMNIPKSRARKILLDNDVVLRGKGECQNARHSVEFKTKWTQPKESLRKRCRNYFSNHLVPKYKKASCELCGRTETLCVHHNIPFSVVIQQIISENKHLDIIADEDELYKIIINDFRFLDPNNLTTVCEKCHYKIFHSENLLYKENQQPSQKMKGSETIENMQKQK